MALTQTCRPFMAPGAALGAALALALTGCSDDSSNGSGEQVAAGRGARAPSGSMETSALAGGAAVSQPPEGECGEISQTAENRRQPADIVFAIDNSGSMDEEIVFVRENMNAFSQRIVDSGIDARIIIISAPTAGGSSPPPRDNDDDDDNGICIDPPLGSGSCPDDSNPPHYLHVPQEVESHDALNLFESTYESWRSQLRPDATKTFVVITDDDAEDEPNDSAAAFTEAVAGLDSMLFDEWTFSGIYCFSECPEAAEIGRVYMDLVTQTGGVGGDLCLQDFEPVFEALAQAVIGASGLACEWEIPEPPPGDEFDMDRVNVRYTASGSTPRSVFNVASQDACDGRGGWYYDDPANPTHLLACPATCDALQADPEARVDVLFGCRTRGPD